jgi:predicted  nucleic acid-binding Zn-ribbon protein
MTDAQIIALGITVLAVLVGTLFSNDRISDLNARLSETSAATNRRMDDMKEVLRAEMKAQSAALEARMTSFEVRFNSIDRKLDEILRIAGDHETRITALEHGPA